MASKKKISVLKRLLLDIAFTFRAGGNFSIVVAVFQLALPLSFALFMYLSLLVSGQTANLRMVLLNFLCFTALSLILTLSPLLANMLLLHMRDFIYTMYGSIRLHVLATIIVQVIYLLPQTILVSLALMDPTVLIGTLLLCFFASSLALLIASHTSLPEHANIAGLLVYLILLALTPLASQQGNILATLLPMTPLFNPTPISIAYVAVIGLFLFWMAIKKV